MWWSHSSYQNARRRRRSRRGSAAARGAARRLRRAEQLAQRLDLLARELAEEIGDVEPEAVDVLPRPCSMRSRAALEEAQQLLRRERLRAAGAVVGLVGRQLERRSVLARLGASAAGAGRRRRLAAEG